MRSVRTICRERQMLPQSALRLRAFGVMMRVGCLILLAGFAGCSAIYHPFEKTIEHKMEVLSRMPRSQQVALDPRLLSQTPPHEHLVDDGDILGLYIEGAPGQDGVDMPVRFADDQFVAPAIGYPTPVRSGGYIRVPQIGVLQVRGMTTAEIEEQIRARLVGDGRQIKPEKDRIHVSLMWRRSVNVMVIRQEEVSATQLVSPSNGTDADRRSGQVVNLPIFQNDVLHALMETGGLPNGQAENAVYVFKRHDRILPAPQMTAANTLKPVPGTESAGNDIRQVGFQSHAPFPVPQSSPHSPAPHLGHSFTGSTDAPSGPYSNRYGRIVSATRHAGPQSFRGPQPKSISLPGQPSTSIPVTHTTQSASLTTAGAFPPFAPPLDGPSRHPGALRIPLSMSDADPLRFSPNDVVLEDGDIVMVESRDDDYFFTAGLLGGGQYALPRDRDLDVIDAVLLADSYSRSTQLNSPTRAIGGVSVLNRDVTVGASRVVVERTTAEGSKVRFRINLYKAMRNPDQRVIVESGDRIYLEYTAIEAVLAFFERHLLDPVTSGAPAVLTN